MKKKLCLIERFQRDLIIGLEQYYKQAISDNIKRGLKLRKEKLSTRKISM